MTGKPHSTAFSDLSRVLRHQFLLTVRSEILVYSVQQSTEISPIKKSKCNSERQPRNLPYLDIITDCIFTDYNKKRLSKLINVMKDRQSDITQIHCFM